MTTQDAFRKDLRDFLGAYIGFRREKFKSPYTVDDTFNCSPQDELFVLWKWRSEAIADDAFMATQNRDELQRKGIISDEQI